MCLLTLFLSAQLMRRRDIFRIFGACLKTLSLVSDLRASWWMFEEPVAADEISYRMRFEQNTFYSSSLASE
jgi:hypothetical protein